MQPGSEKEARIKLLLSLCRFNENTQAALVAHFVNGQPAELAAYVFDLQRSNLVRSIKTLDEVNHTVEQIKLIDLYHLTDVNQKEELNHAPC
jgi:hypothetical protein